MKKNKNNNGRYGAPELKKYYKRFELQGLIVAIIIHAIFIFTYVFGIHSDLLSSYNSDKKVRVWNITLTDLEPPPSTNDDLEQPPEIITKTTVIPLKDMTALDPQPVATRDAEILTTKTQDALDTIKTFVSSQGDTNALNVEYIGSTDFNHGKIEENINRDININTGRNNTNYQQFEVEKAPVAVNLNSVKSSITYPEIAVQGNIEGRVVAKVLVGNDGSILKIGKISGSSVFHNEVRKKVIDLQFTPALQNGKTVNCWVSVPFNFKLK
jgi:TonB family protein